MDVLNIHKRKLEADPTAVGALLDSLSSPEDRLWPRHAWPRMAFDRPLEVGARGGHGPIRYVVEAYTPGQSIRFRFIGPSGFDGFHGYEIERGLSAQTTVLKHTLEMTARGKAVASWPLIYRPMHDALLEDSLALAQVSLGLPPDIRPWSFWVKMLRWSLSGGKAHGQAMPDTFNQDEK